MKAKQKTNQDVTGGFSQPAEPEKKTGLIKWIVIIAIAASAILMFI